MPTFVPSANRPPFFSDVTFTMSFSPGIARSQKMTNPPGRMHTPRPPNAIVLHSTSSSSPTAGTALCRAVGLSVSPSPASASGSGDGDGDAGDGEAAAARVVKLAAWRGWRGRRDATAAGARARALECQQWAPGVTAGGGAAGARSITPAMGWLRSNARTPLLQPSIGRRCKRATVKRSRRHARGSEPSNYPREAENRTNRTAVGHATVLSVVGTRVGNQGTRHRDTPPHIVLRAADVRTRPGVMKSEDESVWRVEVRALTVLVLPIIIQMGSQQFMTATDLLFLGHLGISEMAIGTALPVQCAACPFPHSPLARSCATYRSCVVPASTASSYGDVDELSLNDTVPGATVCWLIHHKDFERQALAFGTIATTLYNLLWFGVAGRAWRLLPVTVSNAV